MATASRTISPVRGAGDLLLLTGPMFAGKSAALIAHAATEQQRRAGRDRDGGDHAVLVLKPAFDIRDGADVVSSRDGTRIAARPVSEWPVDATEYGVVVIDEVQFMVAPHYRGDIVADIRSAVAAGCQVVAAGLDTDYMRRPFEPVVRLAAHASRHVRLSACCHRCAAPAAWTAKLHETGCRLELGSGNLYEARCDQHWAAPDQMAPGLPTIADVAS
ncbi:thymidine kinase [Acetobacteraceae bacterium KSS8]|uniref:Thymidine kinase n=1 Tax=Endosaccharibacter trunci TaxID=2812733 RepID=A0ABT1W9R0_9PROT|nr:thymidine kinase [Acetobacteraceae bacterium KSS8]